MRLDLSVLSKLALSEAASAVTSGHLDRLPPLVIDTCLKHETATLVRSVVADFQAGSVVRAETLTMPRRGFSPRPVTLLSPGVRTLYQALIATIAKSLTPTRTREAWSRHQHFPDITDASTAAYLVEFDIASCYEYIEHDRLRQELLTRTMDVPHVEAVVRLLGEIHGKARGLPQLNPSSDVLADTYLEVLERALLRTNGDVSRYADDFKVEARDWGQATQVIEDAAEQARELGLILATDKTVILKASTVANQRTATRSFFDRYFSEAQTALTKLDDFFSQGYGEPIEVPRGQEETMAEALRLVFGDWYHGRKATEAPEDISQHSQYLPAALLFSFDSDARIPDEWLNELVFHEPFRLENVCGYLLARPEHADNWRPLQCWQTCGGRARGPSSGSYTSLSNWTRATDGTPWDSVGGRRVNSTTDMK